MAFKHILSCTNAGLLLLITTISSPVIAATVNADLTRGIWNVSAVDVSGLTWEGSTLTFESQVVDGDEYSLSGHFDWIGSNGAFGRESFTGTLFDDSTLQLSGFEIVEPASGIATANYFAILTESGTELINGSWDGTAIPSDDWSATLSAVPIPAAVWLFASGILGFGVISIRK
jgi:hypothetical protein